MVYDLDAKANRLRTLETEPARCIMRTMTVIQLTNSCECCSAYDKFQLSMNIRKHAHKQERGGSKQDDCTSNKQHSRGSPDPKRQAQLSSMRTEDQTETSKMSLEPQTRKEKEIAPCTCQVQASRGRYIRLELSRGKTLRPSDAVRCRTETFQVFLQGRSGR
jgi:hypothetical protein